MEPPVPKKGIRNAEVRYKERVENLTTTSHIHARERTERTNTEERGEGRRPQPRAGSRADQQYSATQNLEAARLMGEAGLEYEPEEIAEIVKGEKPEEPDFPFVIVMLALMKDILDVLDLTGFGAILTTLTSVTIGAILFIWMYKDFSGPRWKRKHAAKMAKRLLAVVGLEMIPFLKIIPTNTVWVLMKYFDEKNLAQSLNSVLSKVPARLRSRVTQA